jgi:predicted MFS family arabinose efflux permease
MPERERPPAQTIRLITSMRSGWSQMLSMPVVRGVFIVTIIINILVFPYQQLIAIVASDILSVGPFWMGLLASADGVGAIATGVWLAFGKGPTRQGAFFAGGSAATAALLIALALSPVYAVSLLIQVGLGVSIGLFSAYQAALVLSATPAESRARALGLIATAIGLTPFGMLLIGGLSSTLGAQTAIATMGSLGLLGLLIVLFINRSLRNAQISS